MATFLLKIDFVLILPGLMCDEPADGKKKGRPKAEGQELRSIPVSISLQHDWVFYLGFYSPCTVDSSLLMSGR